MNHKEAEDDLAWFEALAGRRTKDTAPETRQEADMLRTAVQLSRVPTQNQDEVPGQDNARTERLIRRARASGLIEPCRGCAERSRRWADAFSAWWPRLGGAVALLVAVGTVWQWQRPVDVEEPPVPVERGSLVQTLRAADPPALREKLMADLRAAGADVQPYERLGRLGLDADLPRPVPQALVDVATRYGLQLDSDLGMLAVEIEASAAASGISR